MAVGVGVEVGTGVGWGVAVADGIGVDVWSGTESVLGLDGVCDMQAVTSESTAAIASTRMAGREYLFTLEIAPSESSHDCPSTMSRYSCDRSQSINASTKASP